MVRGNREADEDVGRQIVQLDGRAHPIVGRAVIGAVAVDEVAQAADAQEEGVGADGLRARAGGPTAGITAALTALISFTGTFSTTGNTRPIATISWEAPPVDSTANKRW